MRYDDIILGHDYDCRICGERHNHYKTCKPVPLQEAQMAIEEIEIFISNIAMKLSVRELLRRYLKHLRENLELPIKPIYKKTLGLPKYILFSNGFLSEKNTKGEYSPTDEAIVAAKDTLGAIKRTLKEDSVMTQSQEDQFNDVFEKLFFRLKSKLKLDQFSTVKS